MKRWNGWGDETYDYHLPDSAAAYLQELIGPGKPPEDASLEEALAAIPPSRLPNHPLISTDPQDRLRHARGQSFPDWVAVRSGQIGVFPDGVAYPMGKEDVRILIRFATQNDITLIPYGGGTSVVGHINPLPGGSPVLTVDMGRMNQLLNFQPLSQLATFGAGVRGPDLEAQLRARGYTLGHYPQSFEFSTLGGWIAARSSGQQSLKYGRIDKLFAGGSLETPAGPLELPPFPASAAGPDLREVILGSEGRVGIITEATVRASKLPEREDFHGVFFPTFEDGQAAVRQILQASLPLSMLRLSTAQETSTTLALAGHENLIGLLEGVLSVRGLGDGKCLLLMGFTGTENQVKAARREALDFCKKEGGIHVGRTFGSQWHKSRFLTPYLRNTLWEKGYAIDTLETATDWTHVPGMVEALGAALNTGLAPYGEKVHVFTHLSHLYAYGSSIYTTYLFRLADDPGETLQRWRILKDSASQVVIANSGTISHQHGVGTDHIPYLEAEKGVLGLAAMEAVIRQFDPRMMMNPGKLLP